MVGVALYTCGIVERTVHFSFMHTGHLSAADDVYNSTDWSVPFTQVCNDDWACA